MTFDTNGLAIGRSQGSGPKVWWVAKHTVGREGPERKIWVLLFMFALLLQQQHVWTGLNFKVLVLGAQVWDGATNGDMGELVRINSIFGRDRSPNLTIHRSQSEILVYSIINPIPSLYRRGADNIQHQQCLISHWLLTPFWPPTTECQWIVRVVPCYNITSYSPRHESYRCQHQESACYLDYRSEGQQGCCCQALHRGDRAVHWIDMSFPCCQWATHFQEWQELW